MLLEKKEGTQSKDTKGRTLTIVQVPRCRREEQRAQDGLGSVGWRPGIDGLCR